MTLLSRLEAAYWLTLAFRLDGERRRERNGVVLNASRRCGLGLLELVQLDASALPEPLARFRSTLEHLQAADGEVSAMAFLVDDLAEHGIELLPITHPAYPAHLARTLKPEAAPTLLSAAGDLHLLAQPGVCVSGSRKAGPAGVAFARACGEALAEAGITVVTGLAAGPDREALAGSLARGGRAIGVAPEGILMSRAIRDPMVREGHLCVISEFHPKQRWQAGLAMARNRTLAGMSRALFVADCVGEGGTTNQVEVHRKVALPVFLRRGEGEAAFVADLAGREGVTDFPWEVGPVDVLPLNLAPILASGEARTPREGASLTGAAAMDVTKALTEKGEQLASSSASAENHRRDEIGDPPSVESGQARTGDVRIPERSVEATGASGVPTVETPRLLMMIRESEHDVYGVAKRPQAEMVDDRLVELMRDSRRPLSISEIAAGARISDARARSAVKSLELAGTIERVKTGRTVRYALKRTLDLFHSHTQRSPE